MSCTCKCVKSSYMYLCFVCVLSFVCIVPMIPNIIIPNIRKIDISTIPYFLPKMPTIPTIPTIPTAPIVPEIPEIPEIPDIPDIPEIPTKIT